MGNRPVRAFDERSGAPLAPDVTQYPENCPGTVYNSSYTYDAKSRRVGSLHNVTYNPDSCTFSYYVGRSAYDAEDHVVFDTTDVNRHHGLIPVPAVNCTLRVPRPREVPGAVPARIPPGDTGRAMGGAAE